MGIRTVYTDLGFDNYLSINSLIPNISEGINNANAGAIFGSSSIPFTATNMGLLFENQDMQTDNFATGSAGWQIKGDGSVEFNDGTFRGAVVAGAIHIPDEDTTANSFHVNSTGNMWLGCTESSFNSSSQNAAVYFSSSGTGYTRKNLQVGVTTSNHVDIDGVNARIRTSNYSTGRSGFSIDPNFAEFGNVVVRGEIQSSVFSYLQKSVTAGTQIISKTGGKLHGNVYSIASPTLFDVSVDDSPSGLPSIFSVGDIILLSNEAGAENYVEVKTARDRGSYYEYECELKSGTAGLLFRVGYAAINLGQSGDGWLEMTSDQINAPYYNIQTHSGQPWTDSIERLRFGNLNGYLDYVADIYGFAVGSSAGTAANITIDPTNGIRIRSGTTDKITLDQAGNATFVGSVEAGSLHIPDSDTTADSFHADSIGNTWWGCTQTNFTNDNDNANAFILKTGVAKFQNVTVSGLQSGSDLDGQYLTDGTVIGAKVTVGVKNWNQTCVFSATDADTVSWGVGYFYPTGGSAHNMVAGNTGDISATTYIYYDGTAIYKTTTSFTTAVGDTKSIVAVAKPGTTEATFQVFGGIGGIMISAQDSIESASITSTEIANATITGANIASATIEGGNINSATITGANIANATITGTQIDSATITGANIASLTITAANIANTTITGGKIDSATITGSNIASATITAGNTQGFAKSWNFTGTFSATDDDTVAWTSGTFTISGNDSYSIVAGNTGNMSARNWIYWDSSSSSTTFQTTTTNTTPVSSSNKLLIATAINSTNEANFEVFSGAGGLKTAGGSIENATITATQITAATITSTEIANATITGTNIALATISATNITAATITSTEIASATIIASNIANATITSIQIANATITGAKIDSATITSGNIASGTITGGNIDSGTIESGNIANQTIQAGNIVNLTITAAQIANLTITGGASGKIAGNTISEDNIVANTITASSIAANTLTANEIAANTITANEITANTITANEIAANTITASEISSGTITTTELNFTPVQDTNVVASINASAEGITIDADNLTISAATTFTSGYDPILKTNTFAQDGIPTSIAVGDLWTDTNDKNKLYRAGAIGATTIAVGEWELVRDTDIAQALSDASDAITDAATAQGTADGKVTTFYDASEPTAEGVGDLWVDTDNGNKLYRWSGSAWVEIQDDGIATAISDAGTAQATADGKIVTFYQTGIPTSTSAGDLWVDTDDNNKLYRATGIGDTTIGVGDWVAVPDENKLNLLGGSYDSASSGARVRIFPDANTGIQVIDNASNDVFKTVVGGTDVGDVVMGSESVGQFAKWDKSESNLIIAGNVQTLSFQTAGENLTAGNSIQIGGNYAPISSGDTYVSSGDPTSNFGSATTMTCNTTNSSFGLMIFDLSSFTNIGDNITSAVLSYYLNNQGNTNTMTFRQITSTWAEGTVTYNTKPTWDSTAFYTSGSLTGVSYQTADITTQVKNWIDGTWTNYGFEIQNTAFAVSIDTKEGTNKPYLTITFASGKVYKATAITSNSAGKWLGFCTTTTSAGSQVPIQLSANYLGLTGLTPEVPYYQSDTRGAISTSAGTVSKKIGLSITATELLILNS